MAKITREQINKAKRIGSIIILLFTLVGTPIIFLYDTFATNARASKIEGTINTNQATWETRLDRIEKKIDRVIELNSDY